MNIMIFLKYILNQVYYKQRLQVLNSQTIKMDHTSQWKNQSKPNQSIQNQNDKFFSMISSGSLDQQFQAVRLSIISANKSFAEQIALSNKSQKNQSRGNSIKNNDYHQDQDIESSEEAKPRRNVSLSPRSFVNQTYYQSINKNQITDSHSQKDQCSSKKGGFISLLQASLKLQSKSKPKIQKIKNKKQTADKIQTQRFKMKNQNYNIKIIRPSLQKTQIGEKMILLPPTLSMLSQTDFAIGSRRNSQAIKKLKNHPKTEQVKNGIPIIKNSKQKWQQKKRQIKSPSKLQKQAQALQKQKGYRIQKPDQVFDQLQKQKQQPRLKQLRPTQIVTNNIKNAKNLLNEGEQESIKKNSMNSKNNSMSSMYNNKDSQNSPSIMYKFSPSPLKHANISIEPIQQQTQGKNMINLMNLRNSNKLSSNSKNGQNKIQRIISTCLFRLNQQNFDYTKCKYQINQLQIIINNSYHISYSHINKIKLIYSQFNRPQIKLTYLHTADDISKSRESYKAHVSKQVDGMAAKNGRHTYDPRSSFVDNMNINSDGKQKEIIIYMCECYQSIYTIFSSIITRKLLREPQICQVLKLDTLAVTSHMLTNGLKSHDSQHVTFNYSVDGTIMKKSKHLRNWEKRYVRIDNFNLKSYRVTYLPISQSPTLKKRSGKQSPTSSPNPLYDSYPDYRQSYREGIEKISNQCTFQLNSIKQLWTRFEIIDRKYLVLKMHKKNKIQKIEFGIPVINYSNVHSRDNWLFGFVSLLKGEI